MQLRNRLISRRKNGGKISDVLRGISLIVANSMRRTSNNSY